MPNPAPHPPPQSGRDAPGVVLLVVDDPTIEQDVAAATSLRTRLVASPFDLITTLREAPEITAVVVSLAAVDVTELPVIRTLKQHFPGVEVLLAEVAGHNAELAEAVLHGADGMLMGQHIHRFAHPPSAPRPIPQHPSPDEPPPQPPATDPGRPVLTPEELQALLGEDL